MIGKLKNPNNAVKKKQKGESEANLLKHKPECLLVDLIDQRVSAKTSEAYGDDAMDGGVPVGDQVASFVRSIPKNGKSPGVGLGHSKQSKTDKQRQQSSQDTVGDQTPSNSKTSPKKGGKSKGKEKSTGKKK